MKHRWELKEHDAATDEAVYVCNRCGREIRSIEDSHPGPKRWKTNEDTIAFYSSCHAYASKAPAPPKENPMPLKKTPPPERTRVVPDVESAKKEQFFSEIGCNRKITAVSEENSKGYELTKAFFPDCAIPYVVKRTRLITVTHR